MTLTSLAAAFVLVAVVFVAAGLVTDRSPSAFARVWPAAAFEALVLTLLAALWFGSLGHGGWVLLFLLLGALAGTGRWLGEPPPGGRRGGDVWPFVASLLKYLVAGLVCLWRLT